MYTCDDIKLRSFKYKHTNCIRIKKTKIVELFFKLYNKVNNKFRTKRRKETYYNIKVCKILKDKIKEYDCVIIENNMYLFYKIKNKYKNLSKIYFHLHNDILDFGRPKWLCEYIASNANKVIVVSKYLENRYKQVIKKNNFKVLYNCVDLEKFSYKNNFENIKKLYKINESDFVYIYTGRIMKEKGVLELLKAFKRLKRDYNNIKLVIVGDLKNSRREYSKSLKKEIDNDKCIITGFIDENKIPNYLNIANVVVIPSLWEEPFGVVAIEAMAMKKAIIATKSGGLIEPLANDAALIIDKEKNIVDELYKAMKLLYEDRNKMENLSSKAYENVLKKREFDKKLYCQNFMKIIFDE